MITNINMQPITRYAIDLLKTVVSQPNTVVVFDIDDTLINSSDNSCKQEIVDIYMYCQNNDIKPPLKHGSEIL